MRRKALLLAGMALALLLWRLRTSRRRGSMTADERPNWEERMIPGKWYDKRITLAE